MSGADPQAAVIIVGAFVVLLRQLWRHR